MIKFNFFRQIYGRLTNTVELIDFWNNIDWIRTILTDNDRDAISIARKNGVLKEKNVLIPEYNENCSHSIHLTSTCDIQTLSTPNFPNHYRNNQFCEYSVEAPKNSRIRYQIEVLDIETFFNKKSW